MILKGVINVLSVGHSSAPTEAAAAAQKHYKDNKWVE
jgi:hypothetical protein